MDKSTLYYEMKKNLGYFEQNILQKLGDSYATSVTVKCDKFYRYAKVDAGDSSDSPSVIIFISPSKVNFRYGTTKTPKSDMHEVVFYSFNPKDDHDEVIKAFKKTTKLIQKIFLEDPVPPTKTSIEAFFKKYGTFSR